MASRSLSKQNPDPNTLVVVYDLEKYLSKERVVVESQASYCPLRKFVSSPKISFEIPLFRTRYYSSISEILADSNNLSSCISSPKIKFSQNIIQQFSKLKGLVDKVQKIVENTVLSRRNIFVQCVLTTGSVLIYFQNPSSYVSTFIHPVLPSSIVPNTTCHSPNYSSSIYGSKICSSGFVCPTS